MVNARLVADVDAGETDIWTHAQMDERTENRIPDAGATKMNMVVIQLIYTLVYNVHTVITKKKTYGFAKIYAIYITVLGAVI